MRSAPSRARSIRRPHGALTFLIVGALVLSLALSACHARTPAVSGPVHNADDVAFLQGMITHQQQGVELAAMVPANTANAALITLARQIGDEQRSQINGFRAQLAQWQEPLAAADGADPVGTVDPATLDRLKTLRGPAFDELWLQSMIDHHRGAITAAENEVGHGRSPDVITLAKSITASEQDEIDQMKRMLGN